MGSTHHSERGQDGTGWTAEEPEMQESANGQQIHQYVSLPVSIQPRPLHGNPIKSQVTQAAFCLWFGFGVMAPRGTHKMTAGGDPAPHPGTHCMGLPTSTPSPHTDLWVIASQPCLIFFSLLI